MTILIDTTLPSVGNCAWLAKIQFLFAQDSNAGVVSSNVSLSQIVFTKNSNVSHFS
jgi:hypothetical protein